MASDTEITLPDTDRCQDAIQALADHRRHYRRCRTAHKQARRPPLTMIAEGHIEAVNDIIELIETSRDPDGTLTAKAARKLDRKARSARHHGGWSGVGANITYEKAFDLLGLPHPYADTPDDDS